MMAVIGMCLLMVTQSVAAEQAQAYLVLAGHEPAPTDPVLKEFEPSLKQVFGCKSCKLLASDRGELQGNNPTSLKLGRGMVLHVTSVGMERKVRLVDVIVQQGIRKLLDSRMRMTGGAPLFIRCPERNEGLLVIVLVVR